MQRGKPQSIGELPFSDCVMFQLLIPHFLGLWVP